ncbi:MAG: peptide chain release factor N(5)-glutamine methyltransferase, partial [Gammaproteobacteria bacterium]|nr:peptide chain release factor N(5)-glutamine methyltransferase [Gammaproteobacteria bacterium]
MSAAWSVAAALREAAARLAASESPRLDAELLLAHCLGARRAALFAAPERVLDDAAAARFFDLVAARAGHTPLAYLTGEAEFWSLSFAVTPAVLVPRPETELLIEQALAAWPAERAGQALDLGTGSGAIAAALASERPALSVFASDRSAAALDVARGNFARLRLAVQIFQGDWLAPVAPESLDIILANPPYVGASEPVDAAVLQEPPQAVFADADGLAALAAIAQDAHRCLRPGGFVALEHGHAQGAAVRA